MEFTPKREHLSGSKAFTRALVDSDNLEWIELPSTATDDALEQDGGD